MRRMPPLAALLLLAALAAPGRAGADASLAPASPAPADAPRPDAARAAARFTGSAGHIRLTPPRVERGPVVDGRLDDAVWAHAAVLDSFTYSRPVEGVRDSSGSHARVLYDDQNLYIAFRVKDDPRAVQAPIVPRDRIGQGDWVGVSIDTYNDQQRSFFLCANPIGIQMDGVDQEGRESDMAPDFQYASRGSLTDDGYEVEMAVPFRTLRFPPGERVTFGFQVIQDVRRTGAHLYWAPVTRDVNSYHGQIGRLEDLAGIRPGRNLQLNPTHTTSTLGERADDRMRFGRPNGRFGLGAKLGITSNLIADVALTPDFSQVEADAGVVDINERFAIFFDEKRPFFLEGSDIFNSPVNLVYTRRIVDPLYGAKVTGKLGRTSVGVLQAADRSAGAGIDGLPNAVNPYLDHDARYSIGRLKQDVFKDSYVGLLVGDRTQRDQTNRGIAVDGRLKWSGIYSLAFQGAHSWSRDRDLRDAVARLSPGEQSALPDEVLGRVGRASEGDLHSIELARDTRPLNLGVNVYGISPDYAADMGFIRRTDITAVSAWARPHLWGKPGQWFNAIHFPVVVERDYSWNGAHTTEEVISLTQEIDLPRNSWIGMENVRRYIRHGGSDFRDLYRHAVWAGCERFRTLQAGGLFVWGDQVVFAEAVAGRDQRWEVWSNFRLGPRFDGGFSVNGSTVWRASNDSRFAEVRIPRARLAYQFSRELSLRWITELRERRAYDVNGVRTEHTHLLTPDVLLAYQVRPGTVLYLGYGSLLDGDRTRDLRPARSSVFTKLSYLWEV